MQVDLQIENYKIKNNLTYVEAFLDFCDINKLDPEELIQSIGKPLKTKISVEFIRRKMVKDERLDNEITNDFF